MKKIMNYLMAFALCAMPLAFASCDSSDDYWGSPRYEINIGQAVSDYFNLYGAFGTDRQETDRWFFSHYPDAYDSEYNDFIAALNKYILNIDEVLDAYFDSEKGFGTFGTDETTARRWFFSNCDYAIESDFIYFWKEAANDIQKSKALMANILSGAAWRGNLTMHYKNTAAETQYTAVGCTEELDFDLAATGAAYGRGREVRTGKADGSPDSEDFFSWSIDDYGNIIIDFDDAELGQGKGVEMVIYYKDLNYLDDDSFSGIMTSNTQGLLEYDEFSLSRATYAKAKGKKTNPAAGKVFSGKNTKRQDLKQKKVVSTLKAPMR
ncbi:hypothetical protein [Prevotella dentasini]